MTLIRNRTATSSLTQCKTIEIATNVQYLYYY